MLRTLLQRERLESVWQQRLTAEVGRCRDELSRAHTEELTALLQHHATEMRTAISTMEQQERLRAELTEQREQQQQQQQKLLVSGYC